MARIGIMLSSEEHGPATLTRAAAQAADQGFTDLVISDHFHPWIDRQGQSPFVWSVLGAIAASVPDVRLGTAVTCPTHRIHPAIVAQAAATTSLLCDGRFFLGVGSGEALNEHILGDRWPPADLRLSRLEEAVHVMRELWTGEEVTHRGDHYTVEDARLYSVPSEEPPVYVSAFGPAALSLAARIGDGFVTTSAAGDMVRDYREQGGRGPAIACPKVCWGPDEDAARKLAYQLWPNAGLPGELAQVLPTPAHFEQACQTVAMDDAVGSLAAGPDPEPYVRALRTYVDAGFDEIYVAQIGGDQEGCFRFLREQVLPLLQEP